MAKKENKEIKKAIDIIDEMSMDEKEWELYESRRLAIMDYNTGIEEAKEEGYNKRKRRTGKRNGIEQRKKKWNRRRNKKGNRANERTKTRNCKETKK